MWSPKPPDLAESAKRHMRILQLCKKFPYPLKDGEAIAVTYLSRALRDLGCEITLLCMNTTKHYTDIKNLPAEFDHYKAIHCTPLDNSINAMDAFKNLFSDSSYHIERFISKPFQDKLIEILRTQSFDIVQLETLYLSPYVATIKAHSDAQVVMRAHNVEHEIWDRITNNTQFWPKRWYLSHLTKKLRNFEVNRLNDYDFLIALTDRDLKRFKKLGYRNGAMASPIGIEAANYISHKNGKDQDAFSLCFIGSLDWMPNIEGLNWFLTKVWPQVHAQHPEIKLHVAGRNTPRSLLNLRAPNVVIHGEVPDAADFIGRYSAMVVPLFSGSGMRVKILEGMALGKLVITTTLGKEGIEAKNKEELLIADSTEQFLEAISYAQSDCKIPDEIGTSARNFVVSRFNNRQIAEQLYEIYEELMVNGHAH